MQHVQLPSHMSQAVKEAKDWTPVKNGIFYSLTIMVTKYEFAGILPMYGEVRDFPRVAHIYVLTT